MSPMLAGWRTAVEQTLDEQLAAVANPHLRAAMVYSVEQVASACDHCCC